MATEIKMPQLSDTMSSGKILAWNKSVGDSISRGDILAEVETDKANLEIESFHEGVLLKVYRPAGEMVNVGDIIAMIGAAGESVPENIGAPKAKTSVDSVNTNGADVSKSQMDQVQNEAPAVEAFQTESSPLSSTGRIKASPLAKKIAQQKNIDLSIVAGSGPDGRIVKRDLDNLSLSAPSKGQASNRASPVVSDVVANTVDQKNLKQQPSRGSSSSPLSGTTTPFSKMRETIARRMQQSIVESPHFYVTTKINVFEAKKLREILKQDPEFEGISFNHLIIKATAYAIKHEPRVQRTVKDQQVFEPSQINIGIITALEDGILIPVIHEVDKMTLKDLVFEARAAVSRARAGRPSSQDLVGGTFSISNLGMYDVESFTAIINPGQGAILSVGSIVDEPVVQSGQVIAGSTLRVTIGVDHRVIDGAMCGNFMKFFKQALEVPALIMT